MGPVACLQDPEAVLADARARFPPPAAGQAHAAEPPVPTGQAGTGVLIKAAPAALRQKLCKIASATKEAEAWNSQIQRFMDGVVRAVVGRNFVSLKGWAEKALSLPVNKTVLRVTGVGLPMGDASLWALAPRPPSGQTAGDIANTVVARWRERIAAQPWDT